MLTTNHCFIDKIYTVCPNPAASITTGLIIQVLTRAVLLSKNGLKMGAWENFVGMHKN